jgi:hypothetical protein
MTDVKQDLNQIRQEEEAKGAILGLKPNNPDGGLNFDVAVTFLLGDYRIGGSVDYLSVTGDFSPPQMQAEYKLQTLQMLVTLAMMFPLDSTWSILLSAAGGLGLAEVKRTLQDHRFSAVPKRLTHELNGSYPAARLRAELEWRLQRIGIVMGGAYRIANAEVISGATTQDGVQLGDRSITLPNGSEVGFSFSGFSFQVGIAYYWR